MTTQFPLPEIGAETFGDITEDADGNPLSHAQVIRNVITEGQQAEASNLDFFGVGEHHRDDYAISSPEIVLAALASTTQRIKLGTAVTVLSSDDPVRVYERFATLDAISNGRTEIIAGRGSFIESFPLFGLDLEDYEDLFEEKLHLLAKLCLAIIGGQPSAFEGLATLYRRALEEFGQEQLPVSAHFHGLVAGSDEEALETLWPHYQRTMNRLGAERGWPPASKMRLQASMGPEGAMMAGSPDTVARKMAKVAQQLGLSRVDIKYSAGSLPHEAMLESIKLLGEEVKPRVHQLLGA
ncbi:LLM class flavin-dependent oxidoreductase [Glutamicibacter sp. PAEs-4]|uniref:LLM class flavin-dependent oxidoreductase n=1 Tax=Glutamicibacter sp. PAEs-4 TaxID=3444114 RepID=UPI003EBBBBE3